MAGWLGDSAPVNDDAAIATPAYEPPSLEVLGTLKELTGGGNVPVNELPNQPNNNNDAFPPFGTS